MHRLPAVFTVLVLLSAAFASPVSAQVDPGCADAAESELNGLSLGSDTVTSIRYERKLNPSDNGPEVLGVRAWIRLESCSGYLVIDMTRSCIVRQSYTRGNCAVEGVTRY